MLCSMGILLNLHNFGCIATACCIADRLLLYCTFIALVLLPDCYYNLSAKLKGLECNSKWIQNIKVLRIPLLHSYRDTLTIPSFLITNSVDA